MTPRRVLYINAVGAFGGSSRSLFEAMRALPQPIEKLFVMQKGTAAELYRSLNGEIISTVGLTRFDNTQASGYRGVRWLVLAREIFHFPFTIWALLRARLKWRYVDLIHVNEIVDIIPGLIAKKLFGAPMIVHTRCLCRPDPASLRTRWLHRQLRRNADAVIAIDQNVRMTLPADVPVEVIHNSFDPSVSSSLSPEALDALSGVRAEALKVGFVGNLQHAKGLLPLIRAAAMAKETGADVQIVIVGGITGGRVSLSRRFAKLLKLSQDAHEGLEDIIRDHNLQDDVIMVGHTPNIQNVFPFIDVLAFPSYLNAPGRPVFEAAFFGIPSIVAVREPQPDTVVEGETAIAIAEPDPQLITDAILHYADNPQEVRRMGANARDLAERNFQTEPNAKLLWNVYCRVVADGQTRRSATVLRDRKADGAGPKPPRVVPVDAMEESLRSDRDVDAASLKSGTPA